MSEHVNGNKYAPVPGKIPGVSVNLGGRDFVVPPLSLFQVEALEDQVTALGAIGGKSVKDALETGLPIVLAAIQRNYPDMTVEALKPIIDVGNFKQLIDIIVDSSGFKRAPPGEPPPAGR